MDELGIALRQLLAANEKIIKLEADNKTLFDACGMFVAWKEYGDPMPTFQEVEATIISAFKSVGGK